MGLNVGIILLVVNSYLEFRETLSAHNKMLTCNIFLFFVLFITGFLVLAPVKKVIVCLSKVPRGFIQSSFLSSTIVAKERNHCALSTSLANHHFRYLNNPLLQPLGYRYWGTHKNYYYSFKIFPRF